MREETKKVRMEYKNYIDMATIGHYPLFFSEWLPQSLNKKNDLSFKKAGHNVKHIFKLLERHKTIEKKKTALIGMEKKSREEFIRSFLRVVEHESLKRMNNLQ